jgi:hypothetical protein
MNGPSVQKDVQQKSEDDSTVKDFVQQELLWSKAYGQGRCAHIEKSADIGESGDVWHEREERNKPRNVPRVTRGEQQHKRKCQREGRNHKIRAWRQPEDTRLRALCLRPSRITACSPTPDDEYGKSNGDQDEKRFR